MQKPYLLIVLLALIMCVANFQLSAITYDYRYVNYNVNNSLPSSEVYHVIQDSKGFMWFATNQGVCRYDGNEFKVFDITNGLPENTIFDCYEDTKGRIWFQSLTGKLCYYYNNKIEQFPYYSDIENEYRLSKMPSIKNSFYVDKDDNVYVSKAIIPTLVIDSCKNVSELASTKDVINISLLDNKAAFLTLAKTKKVLITSLNNKEYSIEATLKSKLTGDFIIMILINNNILISCGRELHSINIKTGLTKKWELEKRIIWLSQDKDGLVWLGFYNGGVRAYKNDHFNNAVYGFLDNTPVSSIFEDDEGAYWISTLTEGVYYFPSIDIKTLAKKENQKPISINSLTSFQNKVWFGGNSGYVFNFDGKSVTSFDTKDERVLKLITVGDSLFFRSVGKSFHSYVYNGHNYQKKDVLSSQLYNDIIKTSQGKLIFGGSSTFHVLEGNKPRYLLDSALYSRPFKYIYDIAQKPGTDDLLLATELGLYGYTNNKTQRLSQVNDIYKIRYNKIMYQRDTLWLASKGAGLFCVVGDTILNYTIKDGLPSNSINDILIKNDTLWISTNKGIARFVGTPTHSNIHTWNIGNGLISNNVNDLEMVNGILYAASSKGIVMLNAKQKGRNEHAPPIYINKFRVMSKDTVLANKYELNYNQNFIDVNFVGIAYKQVEPIEYWYQLQGLSEKWIKTYKSSVMFPFLPPGKYIFKVKAVNKSGIASKNSASISIFIKEPYWTRSWFYILVLLLFIGIILLGGYLIFRRRIILIQRETFIKNELNKFRQQALSAQMNPHFLYNSLNSAQSYILQSDPATASDYLSKLGKLMRVILSNSQHERISLEEECKALFLYIDIERARFSNSFKVIMDIDENIKLSKIFVPPLIIQPFVENAIHHGLRLKPGEKILRLCISKTNKHFINITVEDNGVGRDEAELRKNSLNDDISYGTVITAKRLELFQEIHKSHMQVVTEDLLNEQKKNIGTKVILLINTNY